MQARDQSKGHGSTEVSITSDAEVLYWCGLLRVSPALLAQAYESAGPRICDVENFLLWSGA